jgi:FkbM family methyltransferase
MTHEDQGAGYDPGAAGHELQGRASKPRWSVSQIDGWWWPDADRRARPVVLRDVLTDVPRVLSHVEGRTCIVQAGGNVGVYALALADYFRRVITVEPDEQNVHCLWKNLAARDVFKRVDARNAAFGEDVGHCVIDAFEPDNCGAHRIAEADDGVVVLPIDALGLLACDCIWLDVEGFELPALKGAAETIAKWSPVIVIEDKGLGAHFGEPLGAAAAWLLDLGYSQVDAFGNDKIFKRTP